GHRETLLITPILLVSRAGPVYGRPLREPSASPPSGPTPAGAHNSSQSRAGAYTKSGYVRRSPAAADRALASRPASSCRARSATGPGTWDSSALTASISRVRRRLRAPCRLIAPV